MTKKLESTAKKVSNGARILDAALCAAFFIASFSVEFYSGWWWFFVGSSALCALTALTAPVEKLNKFFVAKRSEEHTSELQSLMRISYAVFCLKKKKVSTDYINLLLQQP